MISQQDRRQQLLLSLYGAIYGFWVVKNTKARMLHWKNQPLLILFSFSQVIKWHSFILDLSLRRSLDRIFIWLINLGATQEHGPNIKEPHGFRTTDSSHNMDATVPLSGDQCYNKGNLVATVWEHFEYSKSANLWKKNAELNQSRSCPDIMVS